MIEKKHLDNLKLLWKLTGTKEPFEKLHKACKDSRYKLSLCKSDGFLLMKSSYSDSWNVFKSRIKDDEKNLMIHTPAYRTFREHKDIVQSMFPSIPDSLAEIHPLTVDSMDLVMLQRREGML